VQSTSQIVTTNKPTTSFIQAGCPSCHPINSVRVLKVKSITCHGLAFPSSPEGLSSLSSSLKAPDYPQPWWRVAKPLIALWRHFPNTVTNQDNLKNNFHSNNSCTASNKRTLPACITKTDIF